MPEHLQVGVKTDEYGTHYVLVRFPQKCDQLELQPEHARELASALRKLANEISPALCGDYKPFETERRTTK